MPLQKFIIACFFLVIAQIGSVLAADKPATQADLDKLQEQVRTLDKELAVQKEAFVRKLDDVEKRQNEITAQQANSLAAVSNQTATVGNYIAITGIVVTILVLGAGFITYFSATSRAEKEAGRASELWFKKKAIVLTEDINSLRKQAASASAEIDSHRNQVASKASTTHAQLDEVSSIVLQVRTMTERSPVNPANQLAVQKLSKANEDLKTKPESEFTANDFFTRGLSYFSSRNFESALSEFEQAIKCSTSDTSKNQALRFFYGKGMALAEMGMPTAAFAVFEELDQRFGKNNLPSMREPLARGLFHKGYGLLSQGKYNEAIAAFQELDLLFGNDSAPKVRGLVASALVNKGHALGQLGKADEEVAAYDQLDRRFGDDATPDMRASVARGLVNKSLRMCIQGKYEQSISVFEEVKLRFNQDAALEIRASMAKAFSIVGLTKILFAKEQWFKQARRDELLREAASALECALVDGFKDERAMVLGNLGYSLFLLGEGLAAREPTLESLELGGEVAFETQLGNALARKVGSRDDEYERFLTDLWQSMKPTMQEK